MTRVQHLLLAGTVFAAAVTTARADGVTRALAPEAAGCRVTVTWCVTGSADSALIVEERLPDGWTVDTETVPFDLMDATAFNGRTAKFAVKPSVAGSTDTFSYTIVPTEGAAAGNLAGGWQIYLNGKRSFGAVGGAALAAVSEGCCGAAAGETPTEAAASVEINLKITHFKIGAGGFREVSYAPAPTAGTVIVEGSAGLGDWVEIARRAAPAGAGTVPLKPVGTVRFLRVKFIGE